MPITAAFEKITESMSFPAGEDLSAHQYKFVAFDGSGDVILCDTAGEATVGILQNKPAVGEAALVATGGYSRLIASASNTYGAQLATTNAGLGVASATTGHNIRGEVVFPAGDANEICTVRLKDQLVD